MSKKEVASAKDVIDRLLIAIGYEHLVGSPIKRINVSIDYNELPAVDMELYAIKRDGNE